MEKNRLEITLKDAVRYWIVLIVIPSIRSAFSLSEIGGKIMEILIALVVSFVLLIVLGIAFQITNVQEGILAFLSWIAVTFLVRFVLSTLRLPAKLHKEQEESLKREKRKVDEQNWDYIKVVGKDVVDSSELIGYEIELENSKTQDYSFRLEFKYLELDGTKVDEKLFPVWMSGGLEKQGVIKGGVLLQPNTVGEWWLFRAIGGGNNRKNAIVFSDSDERNTQITPEEKYAYFLDFARGEVEIFGAHIQWGLYRSGGRDMHIQEIYGSSIYNFRIDIIDRKPTLKFNPGALKVYAKSKPGDSG